MSWRQTLEWGFFTLLGTVVRIRHIHRFLPIKHPPTPNLQKMYKIELGRMSFPGCGACVVCVIQTVGQKSHANIMDFIGQDFYIWKMRALKLGSSLFESYLKTITMLSTSIHPVIPQQDLSSGGTQTCSRLLQLHYWTLGLFILLWMFHAIQVPRRKTSSIVRTAFVCLMLSPSAKEAICTSSGSREPLPPWPVIPRWLHLERWGPLTPEARPGSTGVMTIDL